MDGAGGLDREQSAIFDIQQVHAAFDDGRKKHRVRHPREQSLQLGSNDARDLGLGWRARDSRNWAGIGVEVPNRFLHRCGAFPARVHRINTGHVSLSMGNASNQ